MNAGPDKDGYYHDKFLRGQPALADEIPRISIKGKGHRNVQGGKATATPEPNFYTMPFLDEPVLQEDQPILEHPMPMERRDESHLVSTAEIAAATSAHRMRQNPLPVPAFHPLLVNRNYNLGSLSGGCDMTGAVDGYLPHQLAPVPPRLAFGIESNSSPVNVSLALVHQAMAQRRNNAAYAMYRDEVVAEYLNHNQHVHAPSAEERRRSDLVSLLAAALGDNASNPLMR